MLISTSVGEERTSLVLSSVPIRGAFPRTLVPVTVVSCLVAHPLLAAAPAVSMFGSFFPSWLICLFIGVVATVVLRVVFILIGLDDIMQWRVPVYMVMALGLTYLFSLLLFGR